MLVDEEDMIPERLKDDEVLPPIYGPSVIHSNPGNHRPAFADVDHRNNRENRNLAGLLSVQRSRIQSFQEQEVAARKRIFEDKREEIDP